MDKNKSEVLEQRRLARMGKHETDARLIELHRKAVVALQDQHDGERVRKLALQRVEKWNKEQLCNPRYVSAWRNILNLPAAKMYEAILMSDSDSISLRQNSPFGFLLHESLR